MNTQSSTAECLDRLQKAAKLLDVIEADELRLAARADGRWVVLNHTGTLASIDELVADKLPPPPAWEVRHNGKIIHVEPADQGGDQ